ncbi:hypothetical protein [Asticcacaulis tiandongensis]|uniref:hypothetical protein n=1 Tax=Asticcacaulis tiandongensis TaxID=2565365 RepID=UPI00112E52BF|nr:hypothetical protein [Asticcacaulis tiandongensis]
MTTFSWAIRIMARRFTAFRTFVGVIAGVATRFQARALIVNPDAEFYLYGWGVELASGQSLLLSCFTPDKDPDWLKDARESLTIHVR